MLTLVTGLDLETTGLDYRNGHRIIEICAQVYTLETRRLVIDFTHRINPEGKKIDAAAQKIHKIAASDLVGKPVFKKIAPSVEKILARSAAVVWHNGESFDGPFLVHELTRAGCMIPNVASFDTMRHGMWASYDSKPPSLQELCWAMGVHYDPALAHDARYDVKVMMEAFFVAVDAGYYDVSSLIKEAA